MAGTSAIAGRDRGRGQSEVHLGRGLAASRLGRQATPTWSTAAASSSRTRTSAWCCRRPSLAALPQVRGGARRARLSRRGARGGDDRARPAGPAGAHRVRDDRARRAGRCSWSSRCARRSRRSWPRFMRTGFVLVLGVGLSVLASLVLARRWCGRSRRCRRARRASAAARSTSASRCIPTTSSRRSPKQFNRMTGQLRESYATLEQKVEDRTRDLAESLEQQTATAEVPAGHQPLAHSTSSRCSRRLIENAARLCGAQERRHLPLRRASALQSRSRLRRDSGRLVARQMGRPAEPAARPSGRAMLERRRRACSRCSR